MPNTHLINPAAFQTQDLRSDIVPEIREFYKNTDFRERRGERQSWVKLDSHQGALKPTNKFGSSKTTWGNRNPGGGGFTRGGW